MTAKMGYKQLAWEDTNRMMKRIDRDTRVAVDEELIKVNF